MINKLKKVIYASFVLALLFLMLSTSVLAVNPGAFSSLKLASVTVANKPSTNGIVSANSSNNAQNVRSTNTSSISSTSNTSATSSISKDLDNTGDVNLSAIKTNSPSIILMDAKSDTILYAKDAYEKRYPASTTKLMTAILTLERCKLTDIATVSHNAIYSIPVGYSHANLKEGEELTIEQLLNVLLIPSANDAAIVLAEHISGSTEEFAKLMNEKAKELGCKNTHFINPNGIHNKSHYSTAYDLALIGKYAMQFPDIMRIAMVRQYTLPTTNKYNKTNRIFNATNALINSESLNKNYYPYATGLKTGYTDSSGSCIVATAKKGNMELIAVVLKSSSIAQRYSDCKTLFDYGFENYTYKTLHSAGDVIKSVEISNATKETKNLDIAVKDDMKFLLKNSTASKIPALADIADSIIVTPEDLQTSNDTSDTISNSISTPNTASNPSVKIELNSDLKAPIFENTVIGKIHYTIDGKTYSSDLVADNTVLPSGLEVFVFRMLLIFLILYIIYRILFHTPKKTKKSAQKNRKVHHLPKKHNGKGEFRFTQITDYL